MGRFEEGEFKGGEVGETAISMESEGGPASVGAEGETNSVDSSRDSSEFSDWRGENMVEC